MRMIYLIAARELWENVKTKGFWIGILFMPLMILGAIFISTRLENAAPVRHFVLIDQSGRYAGAVETAIQRDHERKVLQAFATYIRDNLNELPVDFDAPAERNDLDRLMSGDEEAALSQWMQNGGLDYALNMARPYLREDAAEFKAPPPRFVRGELPAGINTSASQEQIIEALRPYLTGDAVYTHEGERAPLFAAILIPENIDRAVIRPGLIMPGSAPQSAGSGIQYWASNLTDTDLPDAVERSINRMVRDQEFFNRGVDPDLVTQVQRTRLPISKLDPTKAAGEEEVSIGDTLRQWLPLGFVYLMFVSMMMSVQLLLNNTVEEKSNRIIEVLLASVTPSEIMMGKLAGIGLSCFTIILAWLLSLVVLVSAFSTPEAVFLTELLKILLNTSMIPFFIFYLLAGYILLAGIILAIGSICDTLKEAQNFMTPIVLMLIVPLITMRFVAEDPNGTLARIMSWIPPFTPFVMMNRAAAEPPLIDVVGTTILLLVSIVLVLWLTGKIFRHGILRTGQPPKLVEIYRMLKTQV